MCIHIGICDDEKVERDYLKSLLAGWAKLEQVIIKVDTYISGEDFLFRYEDNKKIDILLLDIQMAKMDGVELAKHIRADNEEMQIIFITGFADFVGEGYEVSALHYLMKPVKEENLYKVLNKARQRLGVKEKALFLNVDREHVRILLKDILYIEAQGHYVMIKTLEQEYRVKRTLSELMDSLDESFFRCQRSFIVGVRHVVKSNRKTVFVDGGHELPLSRGLYEKLNEAIIDYFNE